MLGWKERLASIGWRGSEIEMGRTWGRMIKGTDGNVFTGAKL